jgi:hypothetical protein
MTRTLRAVAIISVAVLWGNMPARAAMVFPGIEGKVFQDVDSSGGPSVGEGVPGAVLKLYLDDGDGVFQPGAGDSQVGPDATSAADGSYLFGDLDPEAGYFVQRPAQDLNGVLQPAAASPLLKPGTPSLLIDSFTNLQKVEADPLTPTATSTISDPSADVLGSERDIFVKLVAGVGEVEMRSNAYGVEVLQYDNSAGVLGQGVVTWDGIDLSAGTTPALGLGDVDLTNGGRNTGFMLKLGIDPTGAGDDLKIRIFDDNPEEFSEGSLSIPVTNGAASAYAYLPFEDLAGSVNSDRVNAIQLWLGDGAKSVDAQIGSLGTLGPLVQDFEVTPAPEPTGVLTLLIGFLGTVMALRMKK